MLKSLAYQRLTLNPGERRLIVVLTVLAFAVCVSGCKRQEPTFQEAERSTRLVPEVRQAVQSQLGDLYGGLKTPRSPYWMPINRGGVAFTPLEITSKRADENVRRFWVKGTPEVQALEAWQILEAEIDPAVWLDHEKGNPNRSLAMPRGEMGPGEFYAGEIHLTQQLPVKLNEVERFVANPDKKLELGLKLYNQHCMMCHGNGGDGKGPQSQILNPRPRDFRLGIFKYTTTRASVKASTYDLQQVIKTGIAGTGMPAFMLLGRDEVEAIAEYVKYLAIRGETEEHLAVEAEIDFSLAAEKERLEQAKTKAKQAEERKRFQQEVTAFLKQDLPELTYETTLQIGERWRQADLPEQKVASTLPYLFPGEKSLANPELSSVENGKRLYHSSQLQCATCHGDAGKGDGEQTQTFQKKPDGSLYSVKGLHDDWGQHIKPRDLTYGVFHGGRKPEDLFLRIHAGVKGTPMPAYGVQGLSEAEIWDLVNYLYQLAKIDPKTVAPARSEK